MAIEVSCGTCGKRYRVADELAGRKARCKGCGGVMVVPSPMADVLDGPSLDDFPFEPAPAAISAPPPIQAEARRPAKEDSGRPARKLSGPVKLAAAGGIVVAAIGVLAILFPHLLVPAREPTLLRDNGREAAVSPYRRAEKPAPRNLADARRGFTTQLLRKKAANEPVPVPPKGMFDIVKYPSPAGDLAAYLSPAPADGRKRPAIIWLFGGFGNDIGETAWEEAEPDNDQSASAFRKAGLVMMYPSLRGGNQNPGHREHFLGEVDDVLAAAEYLAQQPHVDPARIYLGGHSTGGTLAMLVAECSPRFRAVFCFGPVSNPMGYGLTQVPFDFSNPTEIELRSPGRWLDSIRTPTFVFEGMSEGNINALREMSANCANELVRFHPIRNGDHFSILAPLTRVIAEKIVRDTGAECGMSFNARDLMVPPGR